MKQFKLIKEYPGSPKLDSIATFNKNEGCFMIENYPEFWEEIKEFPKIISKNATIVQVQLSQDVIFVIGDKVRFNGMVCHYSYFVIDNFFMKDDGTILARNMDNTICENVTELINFDFVNADVPVFSVNQILSTIRESGKSTPDEWLIDAIKFKKNLGL